MFSSWYSIRINTASTLQSRCCTKDDLPLYYPAPRQRYQTSPNPSLHVYGTAAMFNSWWYTRCIFKICPVSPSDTMAEWSKAVDLSPAWISTTEMCVGSNPTRVKLLAFLFLHPFCVRKWCGSIFLTVMDVESQRWAPGAMAGYIGWPRLCSFHYLAFRFCFCNGRLLYELSLFGRMLTEHRPATLTTNRYSSRRANNVKLHWRSLYPSRRILVLWYVIWEVM